MPKIIQFPHDGAQFSFPRNGRGHRVLQHPYGIRYKNTNETHKRKFIACMGVSKSNLSAQEKLSEISFWGEWEAESFYRRLLATNNSMPNAIHEPIFINEQTNKDIDKKEICHSTDPYVFNKYHFYTHCKQQRYPILRNLDEGSIILFGSNIAGEFVLDEVFVVDSVVAENKNYANFLLQNSEILNFNNPHIFYDTNYKHADVLYLGKSYYDSPNFFSFFPCKTTTLEVNNGFPRPVLPNKIFNLSGNLSRGLQYKNNGHNGFLTLEESQNYWRKLVDYLDVQGYELGLYAEEPQMYVDESSAEQTFNTRRN